MLSVTLLFLTFLTTASCYPTGAPQATCLTMFPKHHHQAQQTTSPFGIKVSQDSYAPSQDLTVTVEAGDKRQFMGIQIRAHRSASSLNTEQFLGSFTSVPENKTKTLDCLAGSKNLVTHKNNNLVPSVVVTWKAPSVNVGDIIFSVTVVQNFSIFWTGVSQKLKPASQDNIVPPSFTVPQISTTFTPIDWSTCGVSKGCFLFPDSCKGDDCTAAISYKTSGSDSTFEMVAKADGYVSMGLSKDRKMGDDETILCTAAGTRVTVQHGYNPKKYNERQYTEGLKNLQTKQENGKVFCRFTRPQKMMVITASENKTFDLAEKWYIMLAWGPIYTGTNVIGKHVDHPAVTNTTISVKDFKGVPSRGDYVQMSAILISFSAMFFMSYFMI